MPPLFLCSRGLENNLRLRRRRPDTHVPCVRLLLLARSVEHFHQSRETLLPQEKDDIGLIEHSETEFRRVARYVPSSNTTNASIVRMSAHYYVRGIGLIGRLTSLFVSFLWAPSSTTCVYLLAEIQKSIRRRHTRNPQPCHYAYVVVGHASCVNT